MVTSWISLEEEKILQELGRVAPILRMILTEVRQSEQKREACCESQTDLLNQILQGVNALLAPPQAVTVTAAVVLTNNQGEEMVSTKKAAKIAGNLQVNDDGTFNVVLSFFDGDGAQLPQGTVPPGLAAVYTPSDSSPGPSVLDLTPSADTSSAAGAVDQPAIKALITAGTPLPQGLTIGITGTWNGLATPFSIVAAPPLDIVADANNVASVSAADTN